MYRIRLASGAETTYNSMDEFAAALHDKTVTAEALIYHQRADRWLSVTNHPHYQIALSRAPGNGAKTDASKRQVITAVKPTAAPAPEMPATRVAPRLTIPTPKKAEVGPLRAQENVLEGVVIPKPAPVAPPPQVSGKGGPSKTTVLPLRSAKAPEPRVPDLGEGLDLVEDEVVEVAPKRPSTATPQVDKLLEMLEPAAAASPAPAPAPVKPAARIEPDVELLDLNAPVAKVAAAIQSQKQELDQLTAPAPVTPRPKQGKNIKFFGIAAAAVCAIGAVVFLWKPWSSGTALPEGTDIASTTLPRTEAFGGSTGNPAPTTAQISGTPAPVDSAKTPAKPVDSAPEIVRVRAPRNINIAVPTTNLIATNGGSNLNISASVLIQHYNVAYNDARSELELRMLQIGFTQMFLRSRLTTSSGVEDTRRLIGSATSALRQYRSQENQIERSYQDTIGVAGRNLGWTPRDLGAWNMKPGQKESGETLRLTNLMLSQMDSTFSLLAEQEGKYHVSGETITFENPDAARQYGALRVWLNQQADKYAGSGDALPATLRQVVKAIGSTRLPQERR